MQSQKEAKEMAEQQGRKLMDRVRDRIMIKHYSKSTESIYCHWITDNTAMYPGVQHVER